MFGIINNSQRSRLKRRRRGASAVEFALVCPIFFITIFFCFEAGRALIAESFIEEAAFGAARHVEVVGAVKAEAVTYAEEQLSMIGIDEASILVEPYANGSLQNEIDVNTEEVRVTIEVETSSYSTTGFYFRDRKFSRFATVSTARLGF
jgi:Flp pilus assembly protein TadG